MFAPEGYYSFSVMTNFVGDWTHRAYLAYLLEEDGRATTAAFDQNSDGQSLLAGYRHQKLRDVAPDVVYSPKDEHWAEHLKRSREDDFCITLLFHCVFSKLMMNLDTLVTSPQGIVVQADDYLFLHKDRLDWVYPKWPIRSSTELTQYFSLFDEKRFGGGAIMERYCFVDYGLGAISLKNNSEASFYNSSHFGDDAFASKYIRTHVDPFVGWAVVWNEASMPDDFTEVFEAMGLIEEHWKAPHFFTSSSEAKIRVARRGAKPANAKREFFRLYPNGKPNDLSAVAIAAQLTELGYPISGRSVQNYAKEIKKK